MIPKNIQRYRIKPLWVNTIVAQASIVMLADCALIDCSLPALLELSRYECETDIKLEEVVLDCTL